MSVLTHQHCVHDYNLPFNLDNFSNQEKILENKYINSEKVVYNTENNSSSKIIKFPNINV